MKTREAESRSHMFIKECAYAYVSQRAQDAGQTTDQAIANRPRDALIALCIGTVLVLILVLKAFQGLDGARDIVNIHGVANVAKRSEEGKPVLIT